MTNNHETKPLRCIFIPLNYVHPLIKRRTCWPIVPLFIGTDPKMVLKLIQGTLEGKSGVNV